MRPWFAEMANFKGVGALPDDLTWHQKNKFFRDAKHFVWDGPYLFKIRVDNLLQRCVTQEEARSILWHCHSSPYGGHYNGEKTVTRFSNLVFINLPCARMLMNTPKGVTNV